jgi:hypothetical protein
MTMQTVTSTHDRLLDALESQLEELVPRIVASVPATEPEAYAPVADTELPSAARANVLLALAALRGPRPEQFAEIWWAIQDSLLRQSRPRAIANRAMAAPAAAPAPTGRH